MGKASPGRIFGGTLIELRIKKHGRMVHHRRRASELRSHRRATDSGNSGTSPVFRRISASNSEESSNGKCQVDVILIRRELGVTSYAISESAIWILMARQDKVSMLVSEDNQEPGRGL